MPHLVYATARGASDFSAAIDAELGLPTDNVIVRGDTSARGQTTKYAATLKHPSRDEWAYPEDPIVVGKEARVSIGTATRQTLDASWNGATSNFVQPQER